MKKLLMIFTLLLSSTFLVSPQSKVLAAYCPLSVAQGTVEVLATYRIYSVGDPFETTNIGMFVYWQKNRSQYYGHKQLKYWVDGVPISDGYRFKTVGRKTITLRYKDKQTQYGIEVFSANLKKRQGIKEAYVISGDAKTVYQKDVDVFDPSDIVVECIYSDGSSQNFYYDDLEFVANGNRIEKGYRFKEEGEKKYIIRLGKYEIKQTLTVTP